MADLKDQLSSLMSQLPAIQRQVAEAKARVEGLVAEGSAGGGVVRARVNGKHRILGLTIDPAAIDPPDLALLEDLIVAAINQAHENVAATVRDELSSAIGGLPMGDLSSFLG